MIQAPQLEEQWLKLTAELGVEWESARRAFAELERHYATGLRAYHTLDHVRQVLHDLERLAPHAQDLTQLQVAAWLHDVIYDPRATDNEERSAVYAERLLQILGQPRAFISAVRRLILLTKHDNTAPVDADGRVLLDADLAILGAPPPDYARYAAAIRVEYGWLPEDTYRSGRVVVLQRFLRRPSIYQTAPMRQEREQTARANLQAEIEGLSSNKHLQ